MQIASTTPVTEASGLGVHAVSARGVQDRSSSRFNDHHGYVLQAHKIGLHSEIWKKTGYLKNDNVGAR